MEPQKAKKAVKPGQRPFTFGIVLLVIGGLLAVVNLFTAHADYVPGVGTVETQGTPSVGAIVLIVAGIILAGLGYLKKR